MKMTGTISKGSLMRCYFGILIFIVITALVLGMNASIARAEYANGEVIFAEELCVGEILTGFTVSAAGQQILPTKQ